MLETQRLQNSVEYHIRQAAGNLRNKLAGSGTGAGSEGFVIYNREKLFDRL